MEEFFIFVYSWAKNKALRGEAKKPFIKKMYQQIEKLLIAFYHRDNESSNDFFIMKRNCFFEALPIKREEGFYE